MTRDTGANLKLEDMYTVVGVVENNGREDLDGNVQAELYLPITQDATAARATSLVVRCHGDPLSLGPAISRRIHRLNPDQPVTELQTMETWIDQAASRPSPAGISARDLLGARIAARRHRCICCDVVFGDSKDP